MKRFLKDIQQNTMHYPPKNTVISDWPASLPAASVTSLIGGNGLWWGEDPALLWEFNSITALVKNELKLSLSPPPVFQRLSWLLRLTSMIWVLHRSISQLWSYRSVSQPSVTKSIIFVILICSTHPHSAPNEPSCGWSKQAVDILLFNLSESQCGKIETSYLTEHNEDYTPRFTPQDRWPFRSTL